MHNLTRPDPSRVNPSGCTLPALLLGCLLAFAGTADSATAPSPLPVGITTGNQTAPPVNLLDGTLEDWSRRHFKSETEYAWHNDADGTYLCASAKASATLLYRQVDIDLNNTPWLTWSWKVGHLPTGDDQRTKRGDDYAARIYVTTGVPWRLRSLVYVWANRHYAEPFWPSPYDDHTIMIPLQEGANAGWHTERVNVVDDLNQHFGINKVTRLGVALMSDSDNADGDLTGCFRNLHFQAQAPGSPPPRFLGSG